MKKLVIKTGKGTKVGVEVDLKQVFSEDFKTIARTIFVGYLLKDIITNYRAGKAVQAAEKSYATAIGQTADELMAFAFDAIRPLLEECLTAAVSDREFLKQELADTGLFDESLLNILDKIPADKEETQGDRTDGTDDR